LTSDGTAWSTTIGINADSTALQMRAYKSTDGGRNWVFDGTFSGSQTSADKQMMWVDRSPTSPFHDRIYVIWHNNRPAFVSFRNTSGWHVPVQISHAETTGTAIGSDITTNAAGTVFAVWPDTGTKSIFFSKSTDGGETFSAAPLLVARTAATFQISIPAMAQRAALVGVSIAAFGDNLYVSWVDLSGDEGCKTPQSEPGTDVTGLHISHMVRPVDRRRSDVEPVRQGQSCAARTDQFNHRLSIDPETGVLGIVYYSYGNRRGPKEDEPGVPVFERRRPDVEQSDEGRDRHDGRNDRRCDRESAATTTGCPLPRALFVPSWTDRRDDGTEAIFAASITMKATADGGLELVLAAAAA
jgi:hypothetical protein